MKRNHSGFLKTGSFLHKQKKKKNSFCCCSAASDDVGKTTGSRCRHPSVAFTGVFFFQTGQPIWSRAMLWSAQTAHENKSDCLRDTLVQRMTTKHLLEGRQQPGAWNSWIWAVHAFYEARPCCATLVGQGYRKGEGQLPKRAWECVHVCLCMGEYYSLTPESKDTHATSTAIKVLQSLEEHLVTACTLVKPRR